VPGWHQDITMAECMALMWYVRLVGAEGGTFHTDCLNLVRMWERGEAHCCDAFSVYSGVWRRIWTRIGDLDVGSVTVQWVKGHATDEQVADGLLEDWQQRGNHRADAQAKLGAELHPPLEAALGNWQRRAQVLRWLAMFIGRLHKHIHDQGLADYAWPAKVAARRPRDCRLVVSRCGAGSGQQLKRQAHSGGRGAHSLRQAGGLTFCARCGYYSQQRCGHLARPCRGWPKRSSVTVRKRLLKGLHPVTKLPLGPLERSWRSAVLPLAASDADGWAALEGEICRLDLGMAALGVGAADVALA
jgi:hypothetical protein